MSSIEKLSSLGPDTSEASPILFYVVNPRDSIAGTGITLAVPLIIMMEHI